MEKLTPGRTMIIGEYTQKITDKKRVALPKKFREEIGNKLVVTKGYEQCLIILSPTQWQEMISDSISGPFVSQAIRDTSRFLLGSAVEIELDAQGRFVIPSHLEEYAGLSDESVFLGLGRWIEVWSIKRWHEKRGEIENQSSVIGEKLAGLKLP